MRRLPAALALLLAVLPVLTACTGSDSAAPTGSPASPAPTAAATRVALPRPDHTVVVVLENHAYGQIIGNPDAPYLNSLASGGATLTQSYAIAHPSEPNYYALFSGSTQGRTDDSCVTVQSIGAPNLGSELIAAGKSWASYNEDLPSQGSTVCTSGKYAQKHNPWFGFSNVPLNSAGTFAQFPTDYTTLPKVSFVVPNLCNDLHDCPVATGDTWIKSNLAAYAAWAQTHNSLLLVTFDEDDNGPANRIPTLLFGAHVAPGSSSGVRYSHYDVLRTVEDLAGLSTHAGAAATAGDIAGVWN